jgi:DNA-directed RNA polymerase specialized sigma24 family protein
MRNLTQFNQQVLQCQDDAFTLAWYLLGDEAAAEAAVQAAVQAAFRRNSGGQAGCNDLGLSQVIQRCCGKLPANALPQNGVYPRLLAALPEQERQAVILVDILNIRYSEAAALLHRPVKEVARLVAQARTKMSRAYAQG